MPGLSEDRFHQGVPVYSPFKDLPCIVFEPLLKINPFFNEAEEYLSVSTIHQGH